MTDAQEQHDLDMSDAGMKLLLDVDGVLLGRRQAALRCLSGEPCVRVARVFRRSACRVVVGDPLSR